MWVCVHIQYIYCVILNNGKINICMLRERVLHISCNPIYYLSHSWIWNCINRTYICTWRAFAMFIESVHELFFCVMEQGEIKNNIIIYLYMQRITLQTWCLLISTTDVWLADKFWEMSHFVVWGHWELWWCFIRVWLAGNRGQGVPLWLWCKHFYEFLKVSWYASIS